VKRSDLVASLKTFALGWLFFASVSAIYMNHYSHPKDFYLWNILDAVLAFLIVAVANGLLCRPMMGPYAAPRSQSSP
jgi:arginine exporter protein ArgO